MFLRCLGTNEMVVARVMGTKKKNKEKPKDPLLPFSNIKICPNFQKDVRLFKLFKISSIFVRSWKIVCQVSFLSYTWQYGRLHTLQKSGFRVFAVKTYPLVFHKYIHNDVGRKPKEFHNSFFFLSWPDLIIRSKSSKYKWSHTNFPNP